MSSAGAPLTMAPTIAPVTTRASLTLSSTRAQSAAASTRSPPTVVFTRAPSTMAPTRAPSTADPTAEPSIFPPTLVPSTNPQRLRLTRHRLHRHPPPEHMQLPRRRLSSQAHCPSIWCRTAAPRIIRRNASFPPVTYLSCVQYHKYFIWTGFSVNASLIAVNARCQQTCG